MRHEHTCLLWEMPPIPGALLILISKIMRVLSNQQITVLTKEEGGKQARENSPPPVLPDPEPRNLCLASMPKVQIRICRAISWVEEKGGAVEPEKDLAPEVLLGYVVPGVALFAKCTYVGCSQFSLSSYVTEEIPAILLQTQLALCNPAV